MDPYIAPIHYPLPLKHYCSPGPLLHAPMASHLTMIRPLTGPSRPKMNHRLSPYPTPVLRPSSSVRRVGTDSSFDSLASGERGQWSKLTTRRGPISSKHQSFSVHNPHLGNYTSLRRHHERIQRARAHRPLSAAQATVSPASPPSQRSATESQAHAVTFHSTHSRRKFALDRGGSSQVFPPTGRFTPTPSLAATTSGDISSPSWNFEDSCPFEERREFDASQETALSIPSASGPDYLASPTNWSTSARLVAPGGATMPSSSRDPDSSVAALLDFRKVGRYSAHFTEEGSHLSSAIPPLSKQVALDVSSPPYLAKRIDLKQSTRNILPQRSVELESEEGQEELEVEEELDDVEMEDNFPGCDPNHISVSVVNAKGDSEGQDMTDHEDETTDRNFLEDRADCTVSDLTELSNDSSDDENLENSMHLDDYTPHQDTTIGDHDSDDDYDLRPQRLKRQCLTPGNKHSNSPIRYTREGKIARHPGLPGRPGSGGYSLRAYFPDLEDVEYHDLRDYIKEQATVILNMGRMFNRQSKSQLKKLGIVCAERYPDLHKFDEIWITDGFAFSIIKAYRKSVHKKGKKRSD